MDHRFMFLRIPMTPTMPQPRSRNVKGSGTAVEAEKLEVRPTEFAVNTPRLMILEAS